MLTSGAIARINKEGSDVELSCPILKVDQLSEPQPNKKTRIGFLSDGQDTIKAVFASDPSVHIISGKVVVGTDLKLLDFTPTFVKEKWALMVARIEVIEGSSATAEEATEGGCKHKEEATEGGATGGEVEQDAKVQEDIKMEEVKAEEAPEIKEEEPEAKGEELKIKEEEPEGKEEQAKEDIKMEEVKEEAQEEPKPEEANNHNTETEGPPAKVRIMEEKDSNRPVASPAPAAAKPVEASPKPAEVPAATPQSAAPKSKSVGVKENVTPKSGRSVPTTTPGSVSSRRVVPIAALNPYNETWTIKAKVVGKSTIRTFTMRSGGEGKVASMDLVDEEGTSIGATMWRDFVDKHFDSLEEGKVYFFTRGSVKPANKKYSSTRNDYELSLDGRTTVEECTDVDSSKMVVKLDIVAIDQLASHIGKKAPIDIMGVVVSCGEEGTVKRKSDDSELRRISITLVDQSLKTVECTLWNSLCDVVATFRDLDHPIVSISNIRVSEFQGVSVSTVVRSSLHVNPDTEEAQKLREWYDSEGRGAATTPAGEGLMAATPGAGQSRNARETLSEIQPEELPPPEEKAKYHTVLATFAFMSSNQTFYYMAHPETNRKVVEQNGAYYCEYDGKTSQTMRRRYVLQAKVMDFKTDAWVSVFNDQAEMLLGCTADELAAEKEAGTEEGNARLEETLKNSMWSDWQMRITTKTREYQGESKRRMTVVDMSPVNYESESRLLLQRIAALKA